MPDAVIIGGGHNGLVAAGTLARAGLEVTVLERRSVLGGACVTEELWPGFRVSRAAYVLGLLRPAVIHELELDRFGLSLIPRRPSSYTPLSDGRALELSPERSVSRESLSHFSRRDADSLPIYEDLLEAGARLVEPLIDTPPLDLGQFRWRDLSPLLRFAFRALGCRKKLSELVRLCVEPARDTLERWFESEPLRSTLATDSVIGAWLGPSTPGSGYVLLHHFLGETHGARGVWAYVRGGMGGLTDALERSVQSVGVDIRRECGVSEILVRDGRTVGVGLENGQEIEAPIVLSSADPARTLLGLVPSGHLSKSFQSEVQGIDFRNPAAKINVALDRLPRFRASNGDGLQPEHAATIHIGATSLDSLDASFESAQRGLIPERPMIEMTLPSATDDSLAPPGKHIASLFVQHVPIAPADGNWDSLRSSLSSRCFALVDEVAPGFSDSILRKEVLVSPDLERIFGLTGGNIFHGAMTLHRLGSGRPFPGWSRYFTPIKGLLLCGAGTHPGGGVMGACGRNAAREALRTMNPFF